MKIGHVTEVNTNAVHIRNTTFIQLGDKKGLYKPVFFLDFISLFLVLIKLEVSCELIITQTRFDDVSDPFSCF